jgi:hypothetical protein
MEHRRPLDALCELDAPPAQTIVTLVVTPICCEWIQFWEPLLYRVMVAPNGPSSGAHTTARADITIKSKTDKPKP